MNRLSVGLAIGVILAGLAVPVLPESATELATAPVAVTVVGAGSIGVGILLWIQQGWSDRPPALSRESDSPEEDRVGRRIDAAVRSTPPELHRHGKFGIRREVRETLETVLVERAGLSKVEAADRRRAGSWTSNPRAATFLGESDVRPWWMRARDWLHGDAFQRNLEATVAELDRLVTDIERTHRVASLWEGDHRNVGNDGVAAQDRRGAGVGVRARSRDGPGWDAEARTGPERERLDAALDERASGRHRLETDDSTDRSDVAAAEASEVSR